jgi:hypothetical protein
MKVERTDLRDGSCNYCDRGEMSHNPLKMIYPYKEVITIEGRSVVTKMCDKCVNQFTSVYMNL